MAAIFGLAGAPSTYGWRALSSVAKSACVSSRRVSRKGDSFGVLEPCVWQLTSGSGGATVRLPATRYDPDTD